VQVNHGRLIEPREHPADLQKMLDLLQEIDRRWITVNHQGQFLPVPSIGIGMGFLAPEA
jgi:hypothetical protein